jgi:hypothetical protein
MAEKDEFSYLEDLSNEIDAKLLQWLQTYEMHPLNLIAVILARLTWMAKINDLKVDYLKLLEAPKDIIEFDSKQRPKTELH